MFLKSIFLPKMTMKIHFIGLQLLKHTTHGEVPWYIKSTQKWIYWFIYDVFFYVPQIYVDILLFSIIDKEVLIMCSC